MKLAMAQMSMSGSMDENLKKSLAFCDAAAGSDLLFFPEVQLTPFFPQYAGRNVDAYAVPAGSPTVQAFADKAKERGLYLSPNMYLEQEGKRYDASLWLTPEGSCAGVAKMVHIMQAAQFYERDYYTPSEDGFLVFDAPWGRVGIVICFDRHLPESIRTCALKGADLVIIPTANTKAEPMELFEWEIRVQAMQNQIFVAMCNRVGREDGMDFAGESLIVHPSGDVIRKAGDREQLIVQELDLTEARLWREQKRPYLRQRRPECYL
mgnify:FL=1